MLTGIVGLYWFLVKLSKKPNFKQFHIMIMIMTQDDYDTEHHCDKSCFVRVSIFRKIFILGC